MKSSTARFIFFLLVFGVLGLSVSTSLAQANLSPVENVYTVFLPWIVKYQPPEWIGPDGGLIATVVADTLDPSIVYAGSWGGGIYKSTDGGNIWTWKSRGLENLTVVSLAIDPANPAVLYAGTYGGKLFKTTDGGETWLPSSAGVQEGAIVYSIAIDPANPQTVYLSTRGISNNLTPPWKGVIYRSEDGGASWAVMLDDLGGKNVQDYVYALAIHPRSPDLIFAATHEQGIYRSENRGESWEPANNGISNFSTRAVVFGPTRDYAEFVYTAIWEKRGVFKSENLGGTWQLMDSGISGAQIYAMDIDPFQPKTLYLATYNRGVLKTTNAAKKWFQSGLENNSIATVRVHPMDSRIVFAGTIGDGLYASQDGGGNWAHSQIGLQASSATSLVVSPNDPSVYFTSTEGDGILVSSDRGTSWSDFNQNLGSQWVNALVEQPQRGVLFALTDGGSLYRCDLQSSSICWERIETGLFATAGGQASRDPSPPFSSRRSFLDAVGQPAQTGASSPAWPGDSGLLSLVFSTSNPDIGYLGTAGSGVHRSADGGSTWTSAGLSGQRVWDLAVEPGNPQTLFAATDQAGVVKASLDGGNAWLDIPLPGVTVYAVENSAPAPGVLYAGTSNGVFRLSNGAWESTGLAGVTVASLAFHPTNPNLVFAGTTNGAFISKDGGSTWQAGPPELSGHTIQSIGFNRFEPELVYFSTTAHGVLRSVVNP